jgi:hypothetical protein
MTKLLNVIMGSWFLALISIVLLIALIDYWFWFLFLAGVFRFTVRHYMTTKIHTGTRFISAGHGSTFRYGRAPRNNLSRPFRRLTCRGCRHSHLRLDFADAHSSAPFDAELRSYAYLDTERGFPRIQIPGNESEGPSSMPGAHRRKVSKVWKSTYGYRASLAGQRSHGE